MIMMEVDANEDGLVSFQAFLPLMHNCLLEVTKQSILRAFHSQSDLELLLQTACDHHDKDGTGRLKIKKAASAVSNSRLVSLAGHLLRLLRTLKSATS